MEKLQPGSPSKEKKIPTSCHVAAQKNRPRNTHAAPESDKDSGYSDVASECLSSVEQTDTEECPPSSHWSTAENPSRCPPSYPPPLLLLKNLLVDQGSRSDPHVQSWAVRPSFQLLPTSSQILVFPPSLPGTKPQNVCRKSTKYLPILNSYTKIAPHPSQLSSSLNQPKGNKRGADTFHHSQAKRLPSGVVKGKAASAVPETILQNAVVLSEDASCRELSLTIPPKDTGASDTLTTDSGEPRAASSLNTSHNEDEALPAQQQQNKNRRFQNTLDILRRSGLLSIAMKTKELARLNQSTQMKLERLQEQVALYTKAICSNNPEDWQMLQDSLVENHVMLKKIDM